MSLINHYRKFLMNKLDLHLDIVKCENNNIYTQDGRVVRDYLAQYGALPFGHNPDFCTKAVIEHLQNKAPVFTQPIFQREIDAFARQLIDVLGGWASHVSFTNSGAETVEVGFKLARIKTGRKKILSVDRSFHGKTYSALLATNSRRHNIEHLRNDDRNFAKIPLNDFAALEHELESQQYAAFIVEPIQGEGGMHVADPAWLARARELCSKTRTILIFDEIQTGLGRSGGICVAQDIGITPDIMLLAKSLSGGLIPTGAAVYTSAVSTPEFDRKHSSTFANNGLATCVGRAVLDELCKNDAAALQHVKVISAQVDDCCERLVLKYPDIFSWRGAGLMRAFQFHDVTADANYIVTYLQNSGSLAWLICSYLLNRDNMLVMPLLSDKCSIRFEPPLNTSAEDIADFFLAVDRICSLIQNGRYDILMAGLIEKPYSELPGAEHAFPVSSTVQTAPTQYAGQGKKRGKTFAFLMHFTVLDDCVRMLPPCFHSNFTDEENRYLSQLIMEVGAVDTSPSVALKFCVSNAENFADGMMIMSPIAPRDMMDLPSAEKENLIKDYIAAARREGAEFFGLGAYTSVITRGGEKILDEMDDISFTTGNSLTAIATTETVLEAAEHNLIGATITVIGARGAVGKLMVSELAHWNDHIMLMGRPGTEKHLLQELLPILCQLAFSAERKAQPGSVIDNIQAYVKRTMPELSASLGQTETLQSADIARVAERLLADNVVDELGLSTCDCYKTALEQSDYVVSATSEGKPFLNTEFLKEGAIAIDTARPFDFIIQPGQRVQVLEGGLVLQPETVSYGDCNMVGLPSGVNLACLSETIALALEGCEGRFSVGKSIDYRHARFVAEIARKQGFMPLGYQTAAPSIPKAHARQSQTNEKPVAELS